MIVSIEDSNQPLVVEYIPSPPGSDLIHIETLANDYASPINLPLSYPLGVELLRLNLDGSTRAYIYSPFLSLPMEEVNSPLPFSYVVSAIMNSFPPLSVGRPTPPSTHITSS